MEDVTRILAGLESGGRGGLDALLPLVYAELRRLASTYLRSERPGHTLTPTALAHEAYLKLADATRVQWRGRAHFFAIAARAMRQILVEHARRRKAAKRGGDLHRVTLSDATGGIELPLIEVLALDDALTELGRLDERKARVVELRFFSGMTGRETAEVLGVAESTADDDWFFARAWLKQRLA